MADEGAPGFHHGVGEEFLQRGAGDEAAGDADAEFGRQAVDGGDFAGEDGAGVVAVQLVIELAFCGYLATVEGAQLGEFAGVAVGGAAAPFHSAAFEDATEEQVSLGIRLGDEVRF